VSIQTYVFFEKSKAPTFEEVQNEIKNSGIDFDITSSFELLSESEQEIEGKFEGLESVFDYVCEEYDSSEWDWESEHLEVLKEPTNLAIFNTYSNAQEVVGMITVAAALCKLTGGALYNDFFSEDLIEPEEAMSFADERIENARDQFSGPSEIRKSRGNAETVGDEDYEVITVNLEMDNYDTIAQEILEQIKAGFSSDHEYKIADVNEYEGIDLDFYEEKQAYLESVGFEFLLDMEDQTVTELHGIQTVIRVLKDSINGTLAILFYVPQLSMGIFEFETLFSEGSVVASTIAPESVVITKFPLMFAKHYDASTDIELLLSIHRDSEKKFKKVMSDNKVIELSNFDTLIEEFNKINRHKAEHLESIGWVTKEYLVAQSNGDEAMANAVYQEIQKIV